MLQMYLPIAEMSVNVLMILFIGGVTGVLAGMLGVGGGFLITPLLIFIGVPPTVAVATSTNQIVASSVSGFVTQWRRQAVDFRMGNLLLVGGFAGSFLGIWLFKWLQTLGQIDLVISVSYVSMLSIIGTLMAVESGRAMLRKKKPTTTAGNTQSQWMERLPFKMHFPHSKLYISALLPLGIGLIVGVMLSIMGSGGFFMIPAMIYLLGMPTSVVVGTSLYQIIFITANVTLLHALNTQTVDIVLATLLLSASVFGAQIGTRIGTKMPAEQLRGLMAALVLIIAVKLGYGLFVTPPDIYSLTVIEAAP